MTLALLFLCAFVAYALEIGFSSHTSLSAAHWTEELGLDIGHAGWNIGVGACLDDAGLVATTFGGEYQTSSFSLRVEAVFSAEGFSQLTGGLGLSPGEPLGLGVEVMVDEGGFAGAALSLRYGAYTDEGSTGAAGLLEIDEDGDVIGQTLHVDVSFLPWHMETMVSFGEDGFSSLELGAGLSLEKVEAEARLQWDPMGLYSRGGSFSVDLDPIAVSGEATWLVDGSWLAGMEATLGERFDIQGEASFAEDAYTWEVDIGLHFEYAKFSFSTLSSGEGLGYTGSLSLSDDAYSLEFLGSYHPGGGWELELSVEIRIPLGL